jgi:tellurite resistance protein TerB
MGLFGAVKSAFKAGAKASATEMASKYKENIDFLEAVCAAVALVAAADGEIEDSEVGAVQRLVSGNDKISACYQPHQITDVASKMLALAKTQSGKQSLARQLDDIKGNQTMCEDTYLIAADIAYADGELEPAEEEVLKKIAKRLNVDPSKFEF